MEHALHKVCSRCRINKPAAEYWKASGRVSGLQPRCKACLREVRLIAERCLSSKDIGKACGLCGTLKAYDDFHRSKHSRDGRMPICADCARQKAVRRYAENKAAVTASNEGWRKRNPDRVRGYGQAHRARKISDPNYRLMRAMRCAVSRALRGKSEGAIRHLPYSIAELRQHLEMQFSKGMDWSNYGKWHIDHIRPLASFGIDSAESADFHSAWGLPNLRPLWARENVRKSFTRTHLI